MALFQPLSTARAYFEYIQSQPDPFAYLNDIPNPTKPFFEEEWIDFKGKPQDDKDAKKIWSKALSGYANITDGLVIWGIDARKTAPRNIDAASALRLLSYPHAFEAKLRDWIRDATNPPVLGVEYQSYANALGDGFVVCLVPQSSYKPHRAEFADKNYYFRAGDDFLVAEPGLLRMLFYPQSNPYLWVEVTLQFEVHPVDIAKQYQQSPNSFLINKLLNSNSSMSYTVLLHNTGTATAKDIYVVVQSEDSLGYIPEDNWRSRQTPQGQIAFQALKSLHPDEATSVFYAKLHQSFGNITTEAPNAPAIRPSFRSVSLNFIIYADNIQRQKIAVTFMPDDLDLKTNSATKSATPTL